MDGYKSKHVSMSAELHDRTTAIAERLGCSFSRLVQVALDERLAQWEAEIGGFKIDHRKTFEERINELLKANGPGKPLAELLGLTAPPATRN